MWARLNIFNEEMVLVLKSRFWRGKASHLYIYIFVLLLLFSSCKNMSASNLSNDGVSFKPEVGASYRYEINEVKEIQQLIGSNENIVQLTASNNIVFVYKIFEKVKDNYEVLVQFERCTMDSQADGADGDTALHHKSIEAFKGAAFSFNLLADGTVDHIKGFDEFKRKFTTLNEDSNDALGSTPDSCFNEDYLRSIFEKVSKVLPSGEVVFTNSSWQGKGSLEIGESQSLNVQYTVESISGGIVTIKTTSPIEQTVRALNHSVEMSGKENGSLEVDAETGMLITSSQNSVIKGDLKIGKIDVGMKISRRSKVIGQKL